MKTRILFFRDLYGCSASIRRKPDGSWLIRIACRGQLVHRKSYATERGARIALGHWSDTWKPVTI